MNNKILSVVLVAGIASTWFAALSSADDSRGIFWNKGEVRQILEKIESWESLTAEEQVIYDDMQVRKAEMEAKKELWERKQNGETLTEEEEAQLEDFKLGKIKDRKWGKRGFDGFGKRSGFVHLTEEEKLALESMTDEEKQVFFAEKKSEMEAQKEAHKQVIDKLIAGETLTEEEELIRVELLTRFEDEDNNHPERRDGGDIIAKLVAGEILTTEEQTQLTEMQEKHAERELIRELVAPIMEKVKNGETLTEEEQAILDENKVSMKKNFR